MMAIVDLVYALAATVAMIGAVEQQRLNRLIETSKQIQPGDTKVKVRELLGRPIDQWEKSGFIFKSGPPQWVYGTIVDQQGMVNGDLAVPCPLSIKLRWFGAHESDLVINWAPNEAVATVTRPERAP